MENNITIPANFRSMVKDFTVDLSSTFPEFSYLWAKWSDPSITDTEIQTLFEYGLTIYPKRFFDVLYQNEEIFNIDNEEDVFFLPNVNFRLLFNCENLSNNSKTALWKYLQLMTFTIIGSVKDKTTFGEAMNVFNNLEENELHAKLSDAMNGIQDFFQNNEKPSPSTNDDRGDNDNSQEGFQKEAFQNMFGNMPDMENIQDHLKTLFDGKIGALAKEMAEEIAGDFSDILGTDPTNINNTNDVLKLLMKDPAKIKKLMTTLGGKLDEKMKSGEYSKEELMKEASGLFSKMKDMGGQDKFNDLFKNMAQTMGKNMRVDTNAMQRMAKQDSTRDRLRKNMELKRMQKDAELALNQQKTQEQIDRQAKFSLQSTGENKFVFKIDGEDQQDKSFIHPDLLAEMNSPKPSTNPNKKKKKKNKK